jgi:hypothetical protein
MSNTSIYQSKKVLSVQTRTTRGSIVTGLSLNDVLKTTREGVN